MKRLLIVALFTVFMFQARIVIAETQAPDLGDVYSLVCGEIQRLVLESIELEPPGSVNHGELVNSVLQTLNAFQLNDVITERCSVCIMKPFARGILIAEQNFCGPDPDYIEACCSPNPEFNDSNLCLKYTRADCLARGGVPQGLGSECSPSSYCPISCSSNADCKDTEFCQTATGQCDQKGNCVEKPSGCPQTCDPVCGY